jgi:sensor histidine kinase regulating citrate/malate metabolism
MKRSLDRSHDGSSSSPDCPLRPPKRRVGGLAGRSHIAILSMLLMAAGVMFMVGHLYREQLAVRIANGDGLVKISVVDNGVGIPPENLARIFNHGFTTKKDGHGFGLRSGAIAATEMGGSLSAQSEGARRGATFTLELPAQFPQSSHD